MKLNQSWLMTLCVVGMGAILLLPALGISIGSLFAFLLLLLCPLSHFLMMRGAHGSHGATAPGREPGERSVPAIEASLPTEEQKALEG